MIGNIIFLVFILTVNVFVNSIIFWILLNSKIKFSQAIRLSSTAAALNKLFLSGSGYAAMSLKLKSSNLPFYKSLASFAAFELFSVLPWLILGFYFGAKLAIRVPLFFIVILAIGIISAIYKRKKAAGFIKDIWVYFKEIKLNILLIIPPVLINFILGVLYYFFLLRIFGFVLSPIDVLKIAAISFTLGYLSPAPAGLGFKEGGFIFLLAQKGLSLSESLPIAIADRVILTGFYLIVGSLFGTEMLINQIRKRFGHGFKQEDKKE